MSKIGLIIEREYLSRVKKKSFIIMTVLGPILIAGLMAGAIWMGLSDDTAYNVLVVDQTKVTTEDGKNLYLFKNKFKQGKQINFEYDDKVLTKSEFDESAYGLMLVINEGIVESPTAELMFKKLPSLKVRSFIKAEVEKVIEKEKLKLNNISENQYESIRTDLNLLTIDSADGEKSFKQEQAVIGFIFAVIIYFFIFMYGVQVMRGVMEEKSNRIVEVVISSVKPFQLMMGKIIGIALVGLTQFFLWIILTFTFATVLQTFIFPELSNGANYIENIQMAEKIQQNSAIQQDIEMDKAAINEIGELIFYRINWPLMLGMFVFYFLGGYLIYAALFAAVGAAVDNETDTQQFMMPITLPLIFAFVVSEFALANPEGNSVFWFSIVPFTSPIVMMVRVAMGFESGTIWQLWLSMALLIAGFIFITWMAGKIYRTGILMYGKKVSYKEIFKWLRYKN
jgi:ABC-2 type transport system permease protein